MRVFLTTLLAILPSILRSRAALELENLALRHQIGVLQRSAAKRPKLTSGDRLFWICLSHLWRDWRSALAIVKPETVLAWHRAGFRLFWTWKVRHGQPGRPIISREVRDLIRKMCRENPGWGAPRIHGELLKLGIDIAESSVSKYMLRCHTPPSQTWRTFLENHAQQLVSIDFFTVPTIRFQVLYVFLVLAHDRRRIHTSMLPPIQPRSGPDSNCGRLFPSPSFRATCCATAMLFSATTFENRCETWASAKFCLHRARLGSEPI
jgi:putative transposase